MLNEKRNGSFGKIWEMREHRCSYFGQSSEQGPHPYVGNLPYKLPKIHKTTNVGNDTSSFNPSSSALPNPSLHFVSYPLLTTLPSQHVELYICHLISICLAIFAMTKIPIYGTISISTHLNSWRKSPIEKGE